ncbi:unnamed protein product [Nippostrongylus brasiliensis]|uniref:Uncharacterized protein n=1 Tax=Nippostrongylus brasiliensis TaxID=27835 RepID=A0A0N4Y649_NIPBR|nr:unnamed protein product [Nippostrongylus brasiliensis]
MSLVGGRSSWLECGTEPMTTFEDGIVNMASNMSPVGLVISCRLRRKTSRTLVMPEGILVLFDVRYHR